VHEQQRRRIRRLAMDFDPDTTDVAVFGFDCHQHTPSCSAFIDEASTSPVARRFCAYRRDFMSPVVAMLTTSRCSSQQKEWPRS
jgi:hypothetical protein